MLSTLRERRLEENTLVVFTSDHGEGVAEHQFVVKLTPYDGAAAVPLICSWPGVIPEGREDGEHPVSSIDIVPTLCDYARIPAPPVTGISLRPWMEGRDDVLRECVVCELSPFRIQPERLGRVLRTRQYKYMAFTDGERPEVLFDMRADPGETSNLADSPEYSAELARHRRLLAIGSNEPATPLQHLG